MITIKDIAKMAGVSRGTVDRVLHNRSGVSEKSRKRVLQVIEETGFSPNKTASALAKSAEERKIALVYPKWGGYAGKFIDAAFSRAQSEMAPTGVKIIDKTFDAFNQTECVVVLEELLQTDICALAIMVSDIPEVREALNKFAQRDIPVVTFNTDVNCIRCCYVGEDSEKSGRVAAEILSKFMRPNDHILIVSGSVSDTGQRKRLEGFVRVMQDKGINIDERGHIVYTNINEELTYKKVYNEVKENPQIECIYISHRNARACCDALDALGLGKKKRIVGHDVSENKKQLLKDGRIDFTIDQKFYDQTYRALCVLQDIVIYNEYPENEFEITRSSIVNAENIDEYLLKAE